MASAAWKRQLICLMSGLMIISSAPAVAQDAQPAPVVRMLPPIVETFPLAFPENPSAERYILGPGDQLAITDYSAGEPDKPPYVERTFVSPDGTITIFPIGVLRVAGTTIEQLNHALNANAGGRADQPQIIARLVKPRPVSVYVLGDVLAPGIYTADPGLYTTRIFIPPDVSGSDDMASSGNTGSATQSAGQLTSITNAFPKVTQMTLLTALQMSGGLKDTADIARIRVTRRATNEVFTANLWKLLAEGDASQDVTIRDGDVVFVARGGVDYDTAALGPNVERTRRVRVIGAVKKPGMYDLLPEDDVYSAIARAGGFTELAVQSSILLSRREKLGNVTVKQLRLPTRKDIRLTIRKSNETELRAPVRNGDVLIAIDSIGKRIGPKASAFLIATLGAVLLLYLSRNIVDRSISTTNTAGGTVGASTTTINRLF